MYVECMYVECMYVADNNYFEPDHTPKQHLGNIVKVNFKGQKPLLQWWRCKIWPLNWCTLDSILDPNSSWMDSKLQQGHICFLFFVSENNSRLHKIFLVSSVIFVSCLSIVVYTKLMRNDHSTTKIWKQKVSVIFVRGILVHTAG